MMWAITSYFNPAGDPLRKRNYGIFRKSLNLPLIAVEVVMPGAVPEVTGDDADVIVHVPGDVMMQKERALNLGLRELPDDCDKVLVIDCDIVPVSDPGWDATKQVLGNAPMVHPFARLEHQGPDGDPEFVWPSIVRHPVFAAGVQVCHGGAWGFRREFIERVGFHDKFIVGGADAAMTAAAFGAYHTIPLRHSMNDARVAAYMEWAVPFARAVECNVVCTNETVRHLWHGTEESRQYRTRKAILEHFNPTDVSARDGEGLRWRYPWDPWDSERVADMRRKIIDYYQRRVTMATVQTKPRGEA